MASKDSKTNFALLKKEILGQNGKEYWRSVEEFVDAPEFEEYLKHEHPERAEEWDSALSRRNFIKVMGASLALAGLSGCVIQPSEKAIPYVRQPEEIIPGKPLYFATAMTLGGIATGLLGRSSEGKPTKIEGNPGHPGSLGATDVLAQASLLNLYDPDRSKEILNRGIPKTWQIFMKEVRAKVEESRGSGGAGIRFLTETVTSPTLIDQMNRLLQELPNAKWIQYEPVNDDNSMAGARLAFGTPAQPIYRFDRADRVLSLDADIFSSFNVRYIKDFSKKHTVAGGKREKNRLYTVETTMTLTGAKADHRLAVKPSELPEVAKAIAAALGVAGASSNYTGNAQWIQEMAKDLLANRGRSLVVAGDNQPPVVHALAYAMNSALGNIGQTINFIEPLRPNAERLQIEQLAELIREIDAGQVKMLVVLDGNPVYNTPVDLKLDKARMDKIPLRIHLGQHLDETGVLCHWHVAGTHYLESWGDARAFDGTVSIVQPLIEPLYGGKSIYEVVQIFFRENFEKNTLDIVKEFWQKQGFSSSTTVNQAAPAPAAPTAAPGSPETAATSSESAAAIIPPQSANGGESRNTGVTPADPSDAPEAPTGPTEGTAATNAGPSTAFEDQWRKAVHDGYVGNSAVPAKTVTVGTGFLGDTAPYLTGEGELEIAILPDPSVYDGRFSNNSWLQELPKPLNKITWENVALVSPNTARQLGINQDKEYNDYAGGELGASFITTKGGNLLSDILTVTYQGETIGENVPAWISPGQPDGVITLFMGYGRTRGGSIGMLEDGAKRGYNVFDVRRSDALWFGKGSVVNTNVQATIASTQIHFNMEGREILLHMGMDEYEHALEERFDEIDERYKLSMFRTEDKDGYGGEFEEVYENHNRWAMTIDLNSCVGCNACVIACQSENNIPVVGKEQVERSREMHWMRIDAYYKGEMTESNGIEGPHFQPVLCQQCEQAPCELVCPVHATVHSAEGLNDMVYNRCIGTRYCSNNCPYKVRRFNFMLYQDWETPQYKMMRNPEVTVRSRGVMEKCTYCTQRIVLARIESEKAGREIIDGEVVTACQAVCPADAIVFGNLNDQDSQVAKSKQDRRNYALLNHELNTQPRTTYLAGVKNQNKAMPDYIKPEKKDEGGH